MNNWFWIYLLSVSDGVGSALCGVGGVAFGLSTVALLVSLVLWDGDEADREISSLMRRWLRVIMPCSVIAVLLGLLVPNTDDLVKAYFLVEGSELVTSENAEAAAKAVGERVDKLIDSLTK